MQVAHGVAAAQSQPAVSKADASKVWALAASTQDDDLLDDDELLTEEDQRPPVVPGTLQLREEDQRVLAGWVVPGALFHSWVVGRWLLTEQDQRLPEVPGVPGTPHLLVCLATVGWCSCLIVRRLSNKGGSVAG